MIKPRLILQNRYCVVQQLGKGGFGEIFEVDNRGKPKVLKVLNLGNFRDPENKQKAISLFQREADVLMHLNHPGIPQVESDGYFTWQDGNSEPFHCLVMEKIDGHNLQEWLQQRNNQAITQELAIDWLKQLVAILAYLHQQHYFHRDIKPSNIMLKPDGQLVLIDFGTVREVTGTYLAKLVEDREVTQLISQGYTPLEQRNGKAVLQSDFFALGRTFVHLLTGKHPDKLPEDDLTYELTWRNHCPTVGEPLANLIDWLMAPFVGERPQTAKAIWQRLADSGLVESTGFPIAPALEQKGINQQNTKSKWLRQLLKTTKPFIGLGIASIATVSVLNLLKFTSPQPQSPALLPNFSLVKTFDADRDVVNALAFSPDGQTLATGSFFNKIKFNEIKLWNWRTGKRLQAFPKASLEVWVVAISPDGRLLASGHRQDKTIKLWDLGSGKLLRTLKGHSGEVRSLVFSPNGKTLASSSHDKNIKLWRLNTGELLHTFSGHTNHIGSVAFSPDGKTLTSASDDRTIKLWNLDTMKLTRTLTGHSEKVLSVAFSANGQTLISGSADNTIKLWNPRTGELQSTLTGHTDWVWCLAISPDGQTFASGSYDNSIKLWNLRTAKELQTLTGHSESVYSVAFSPDGQNLASGSDDATVKIWRISPTRN